VVHLLEISERNRIGINVIKDNRSEWRKSPKARIMHTHLTVHSHLHPRIIQHHHGMQSSSEHPRSNFKQRRRLEGQAEWSMALCMRAQSFPNHLESFHGYLIKKPAKG
jgi:hypothetical protein